MGQEHPGASAVTTEQGAGQAGELPSLRAWLAATTPIDDADAALDDLLAAMTRELPGFRLACKADAPLQRAIAALLWPVNRQYMTDYTTVLGRTIWSPWRDPRRALGSAGLLELLAHEAVHLLDAKRFPLLFEVSYLLLPLPVVVTARALWEARAYRVSARLRRRLGAAVDEAWIEAVVRRFVGPDYAWMAPFPWLVRWWLRRELARFGDGASPPPSARGASPPTAS